MTVRRGTLASSDSSFQFAIWNTPFQAVSVDLLDVTYSAQSGDLYFRIWVEDSKSTYKVIFENVSAFRVLDEHGLLELWTMTKRLSGRPAQTTFRVRNNSWCKESPLTFQITDGWSFVVATDSDCIEIVAAKEPAITLE